MSVETPQYLAMLRRMIRAAGRRVGEADELELADLLSLHAELDEAVAAAVDGQRVHGKSWQDIARGTGTTRQAAHLRYGQRRAS